MSRLAVSTPEAAGAAGTTERSGFLPERIVHLHPTRLCNLACLHCYSQSGPDARGALDPATVIGALEVLRGEGYRVLSLSGGEPLVYRGTAAVVKAAKQLGFRVTMITNGLLAARHEAVIAELDAIAVSFDGLGETHDAIRARPGAFDLASAALRDLAAAGRPVAAAISMTRGAIPELPELAYRLAELGARTLQIRPVAGAGRAKSMSPGAFGNAADRARLFIVSAALRQELGPHVQVHCDLAPARGLWNQREAYAPLLARCDTPAASPPLAELVNPLVIDDTGRLKPVAYDFDARFDIAALEGLTSDRLHRYKQDGLADFRELMGSAIASLEGQRDLVDWFDFCARLSESRAFEREPAGGSGAGLGAKSGLSSRSSS